MTVLSWTLWGLIIASAIGVMVGRSELAYDKIRGCGCAPDRRTTGLLYVSGFLGVVAGAANTAVTAAMT